MKKHKSRVIVVLTLIIGMLLFTNTAMAASSPYSYGAPFKYKNPATGRTYTMRIVYATYPTKSTKEITLLNKSKFATTANNVLKYNLALNVKSNVNSKNVSIGTISGITGVKPTKTVLKKGITVKLKSKGYKTRKYIQIKNKENGKWAFITFTEKFNTTTTCTVTAYDPQAKKMKTYKKEVKSLYKAPHYSDTEWLKKRAMQAIAADGGDTSIGDGSIFAERINKAQVKYRNYLGVVKSLNISIPW